MSHSIVKEKSEKFSIRITNMKSFLVNEKKEYRMSDQVYRSGTSIGANIAEAYQAQSKKDFISKLCIALKEASETEYWLKTLYGTGYLSDKQYESISHDCIEIKKILIAMIKTSKK